MPLLAFKNLLPYDCFMVDRASHAERRRTFLYENHITADARMGPFGGFLMPIQYEGIIREHHSTRESATIFDTCHMGEFRIEGDDAVSDLERIITCHIASIALGQCRYGLMCNEKGGVIDDLLIYRLSDKAFMIVVNAATQDDDFAWIESHISPSTRLENQSAATAKLDLQGPDSPRIMQELMERSIDALNYYRFMDNKYADDTVLVSRTGYTGEMGFELYCDSETAIRFWDDCLELGVLPAGLGARDTLRLEMGFPLYGHELTLDRNAAEAGFTKHVVTDRVFIGSEILGDHSLRTESLVGIVFEDRRAARAGDTVIDESDSVVGTVTSGSFAPSLGRAVAMSYVSSSLAQENHVVRVRTAREVLLGTVVRPPFYKEATARRRVADFL